jgi:hypothetical protein
MRRAFTTTVLSRGCAGGQVSERAGDVIVLTSCTATKVAENGNGPRTAESLYAGQQHIRLMEGVRTYRAAGQPAGRLKLRIVSAGHGVVAATTRVASYNKTFQGLPREAIRRRADALHIPDEVERVLSRPYRLAVLLLGDDYLEACGIDEALELGGPTFVFCGARVGDKLPDLARLHHVSVGNPEAARFGCGTIALKGELGRRLLSRLATSPTSLRSLLASGADTLAWLETTPRHKRSRSVLV